MRALRSGHGTAAIVLSVAAGLTCPALASATGAIAPRAATAAVTYASESTTSLRIAAPSGTQPGDVLLAALGFGNSGAKAQPTLSAPAGWTLVRQINQG
ncbi:MAG: hypothetical protein QOG68_1081, partial [Solirubrobacteraceae bacterium]|nr:hypothetical protein [Solirubrobacteraceae bacterium]